MQVPPSHCLFSVRTAWRGCTHQASQKRESDDGWGCHGDLPAVAATVSSANMVHPMAAEERLSMSKHRVCLTVVVIHAVFTRDANR
jgi:hypothetical protein